MAFNRNFDVNDIQTNPSTSLVVPRFGSRDASSLISGAVRSVRVLSCTFNELPGQSTAAFRPFVSNVNDSNVLERIPEFVRQSRFGGNFNSEEFNNIANDIISVSGSTFGNIPIVNGWNTRRYSFVIKAEIVKSNGNRQEYMVEGYTDSNTISSSFDKVYVDKQLVLHVNNVTSFAERTNIHSGVTSLIPFESYNVIHGDSLADDTNLREITTQRPYDISSMAVSGMLVGNTSNLVVEANASIGVSGKTSKLENNNPSTFISKIINNGIKSVDNSNTDTIFNQTAVSNMGDNLVEPHLADNGFLTQLGRISRDYSTSVTSFTWGELLELDNTLSNPSCPYLYLTELKDRASFLPSSGNQTNLLTGSGIETLFASSISTSLPDLMARCNVNSVTIVGTNFSGVDEATVTAINCFTPGEERFQLMKMQNMFVNNIMRLINVNSQLAYNVSVSSCAWGETFIKLNLDGVQYDYMFPNFANSLLSPVISNSRASTKTVGQHLLSITNDVIREQNNMITRSSGFGNSIQSSSNFLDIPTEFGGKSGNFNRNTF